MNSVDTIEMKFLNHNAYEIREPHKFDEQGNLK